MHYIFRHGNVINMQRRNSEFSTLKKITAKIILLASPSSWILTTAFPLRFRTFIIPNIHSLVSTICIRGFVATDRFCVHFTVWKSRTVRSNRAASCSSQFSADLWNCCGSFIPYRCGFAVDCGSRGVLYVPMVQGCVRMVLGDATGAKLSPSDGFENTVTRLDNRRQTNLTRLFVCNPRLGSIRSVGSFRGE